LRFPQQPPDLLVITQRKAVSDGDPDELILAYLKTTEAAAAWE
jgi:hypothetical protein